MKSWKEVERIARDKDKVAKEMEELSLALTIKAKQLMALNLEQFQVAPEVDTLFDSSPISNTRVGNDFRFHLVQIGCPWERRFDGPELPTFTETIRLGNKWILKARPKPMKAHEEI